MVSHLLQPETLVDEATSQPRVAVPQNQLGVRDILLITGSRITCLDEIVEIVLFDERRSCIHECRYW